MSWSIGYDTHWGRDIGYGVPATCDYPGCGKRIDRGLAFVCGGEPYGGDDGCGLYFCEAHHMHARKGRSGFCTRCANYRPAFKPTPDVPEWITHKLTDDSWAEWRADNPGEVERLKAGAK